MRGEKVCFCWMHLGLLATVMSNGKITLLKKQKENPVSRKTDNCKQAGFVSSKFFSRRDFLKLFKADAELLLLKTVSSQLLVGTVVASGNFSRLMTPRYLLWQELVEQVFTFSFLFQIVSCPLFNQCFQVVGIKLHS